ncbi:hypothetical protein JCM11641_004324 [Rhodosporidiobolus odoratus]
MASVLPAGRDAYFLRRVGHAELDAMDDARRVALADPLEVRTRLAWNGPNLHPDSLPPNQSPSRIPRHDLSNPPRPLLPFLLDSDSPIKGGAGWSLRLVEPLQNENEQWSQVWRCEVSKYSQAPSLGTIVLKIRQQSLFPEPEPRQSRPEYDSYNWYPARHLELREALARMRQFQGRDVPLCYGFYSFKLPCGETAVGAVLEDLVEETIPLATYFKREEVAKRLSMDAIEPFVGRSSFIFVAFELTQALQLYTTFRTQARLRDCNVLDTGVCLSNILVVRNGMSPSPATVFIGFGRTTPTEVAVECWEKGNDERRIRGVLTESDLQWSWRKDDQRYLKCEFDLRTEGSKFSMWWRANEAKIKQELPFLELTWNY